MIDDLLTLVGDLSTPVKVGWLLWVAWAAVLVVWFRRGRTDAPAPLPMRTTRNSTVRSASASSSSVKKPVSTVRAGGSPEFLAALGLDEPKEENTQSPSPDQSLYT